MSREESSKLLSFVLRHRPDAFGLTLDAAGWVPINTLLAALLAHGRVLTHQQVLDVVNTSDKRRFAISDDGARIRASQGHSHKVVLGYPTAVPPALLFHGTVGRFLDSIRRDGLRPGSRQHVHLSPTVADARVVGQRRGTPVVLEIGAGQLAETGHLFLQAPNGVWLTDAVPVAFIRFPV